MAKAIQLDYSALGNEVISIPLSQGKFAAVDKDEYGKVRKWKWYFNKGYAVRNEGNWRKEERKTVRMHRTIMDCPVGKEVDHIDGNGLNNTKKNLRICSRNENCHNREKYKTNKSGFKGVYWESGKKKWKAQATFNNRRINLGRYPEKISAARAYDLFAMNHFGQFARLNLPYIRGGE